MNFFSCLVILTVACYVCGQDDRDVAKVERGGEKEESSREGKQLRDPLEHGGWRAVDNRWQTADEWIPKETHSVGPSSAPENPIPRRRRIRKRKRRPPPILISEESAEYLPRRRRIRPQTLQEVNDSWVEIEEESTRRSSNRRRIIPVYAPEISVEESVEIEPPSPVLHFDESTEERAEEPQRPQRVYERVRDPFTALEEVEAKARLKKKQETEQDKEQEMTTVSNLKTLLKQSGGALSLSELLQQNNLSLGDLLKGKQQAISVLTEKPEINTEASTEQIKLDTAEESTYKIIETSTSTEAATTVTNSKPKVEDSVPTKQTNRNYEVSDSSFERLSKEEVAAQRQRIAQVYSSFENKKLTTVTNYEVVTEPTTDRRIFVPSHPKYYTSFNYKPDMTRKVAESIMKPTTKFFAQTTRATPISSTRKNSFSSKYLDFRSKYVSLKPKIKVMPITSAKLNKPPAASAEPTTTTMLPPKAFKIDIKDMFGMSKIAKYETKPKEDGPLRMSINIESLMDGNSTEKSATDYHQTFKKDLKDLENSENEVTTDILADHKATMKHLDKIKPTSAREEIMEILKDHVSKQNLSRILELRNMTIEELVAQRERGSSQLHLADIFHNQTREPEPPNEPYVGHIDGLPSFFDRKPKTIQNLAEIKKDSEGSKYFASVIDLKPLELTFDNKPINIPEDTPPPPVVQPKEKYTVTSFPTYKIEMEKIIKQNQPPPFQLSVWKSLYPNLYTGNAENSHPEGVSGIKTTKFDDLLQNEVHRIEDIENTLSDAVNDKLNIDLDENHYDDEDGFIRLPSGVKSAIIASAAIVGISLLVFLTIFIIFKWSQKQKKRLCYSDSLSCSRIKSPILETRPKRTIRTIMSETLGRKKKYCNVYPQSMSDYIWENDKKPFQ